MNLLKAAGDSAQKKPAIPNECTGVQNLHRYTYMHAYNYYSIYGSLYMCNTACMCMFTDDIDQEY